MGSFWSSGAKAAEEADEQLVLNGAFAVLRYQRQLIITADDVDVKSSRWRSAIKML